VIERLLNHWLRPHHQFFCDVLTRRVAISADDFACAAQRIGRRVPWRRRVALAPSIVMERLRERKQSIAEQLESRQAAAQFEPPPPPSAFLPLPIAVLPPEAHSAAQPAPLPATPAAPQRMTPDSEEDSYTSRLLKAKRRALDKNWSPQKPLAA
jgi:hypothetical protein